MSRETARRRINRAMDRAVATSERRARTGVDRNPQPFTFHHMRAFDRAVRASEARRAG